MESHEIEEMLYHRAIRTKLRAPLADRMVNIGYNRAVASGVVAGAALVCTLAMSSPGISAPTNDAGSDHGQRADMPAHLPQPEMVNTSLAMTH